MVILVLICSTLVYKEITDLFELRDRRCGVRGESELRWITSAGRYCHGEGRSVEQDSELVLFLVRAYLLILGISSL